MRGKKAKACEKLAHQIVLNNGGDSLPGPVRARVQRRIYRTLKKGGMERLKNRIESKPPQRSDLKLKPIQQATGDIMSAPKMTYEAYRVFKEICKVDRKIWAIDERNKARLSPADDGQVEKVAGTHVSGLPEMVTLPVVTIARLFRRAKALQKKLNVMGWEAV